MNHWAIWMQTSGLGWCGVVQNAHGQPWSTADLQHAYEVVDLLRAAARQAHSPTSYTIIDVPAPPEDQPICNRLRGLGIIGTLSVEEHHANMRR